MKKIWIVALLLGLIAGVSNYLYASSLYTKTTGGKKIKVVVTVNQVKQGEELKVTNVGLKEIPIAYVDKRFITEKELEDVLNLPLAITISEGQIITWTDFEKRDDSKNIDLASYIKSGQRAITIPVDGSLSLGGLLKPGHRVDIIGTFKHSAFGQNKDQTMTLLQNITVLATGSKLEFDSSKKDGHLFSTVTLGVSVEQSELLSFATQRGRLAVILRVNQDLTVTKNIPSINEDDLFKLEKINEIQKSSKKQSKIQTGKIERLIEQQ